MRDPLDAVFGHHVDARLSGRDVHTFALPVQDLRNIFLGVDLDFVVVSRLLEGQAGDDLHRLAGGEHAVHSCGADTDALLATAHSQSMEFGPVQ